MPNNLRKAGINDEYARGITIDVPHAVHGLSPFLRITLFSRNAKRIDPDRWVTRPHTVRVWISKTVTPVISLDEVNVVADKILLISDTHMRTGVGVCEDAINTDGENLPKSEADPLTVSFTRKILDIEKPDFVIFTGDQVYHDIYDTQSALFKVFVPMVERSIPWVAVSGNHDDEGPYALSRAEQMSILQNLPFSLCESGPEEVDGIGNFYLQVLPLASAPSQAPLSTLYFLDSHGQIPSIIPPGYDPIKQSQIDWFSKTSQGLRKTREENDDNNPSHLAMVFQHIPFPEFGYPDLRIYKSHRGSQLKALDLIPDYTKPWPRNVYQEYSAGTIT